MGADLGGANLQYVNLEKANLSHANLEGANLEGVNLADAHVRGVKYDSKNLKCQSVNASSCWGYFQFRRDLMDQDYILQMKKRSKWLYRLWSWSSDCGRSFKRWAWLSLGTAGLFALAFSLLEFFMPGSFDFPHNADHQATAIDIFGGKIHADMKFDFFTMLYYSIVTFTTLGFGDVTPLTKWAALAVTLEVIVGYIMLGGLISIFANKLARRS